MITKTAFILAAGKGTRLRPLTDHKPKPMVEVAGKPLIDYIVNQLKNFGIQNIIINLFYLGDKIKIYFKDIKNINLIFSDEHEVLETGGGVKNALSYIQDDVFFLINGDAFWTDKPENNALESLNNQWDSNKMDILLLLQPVEKMLFTEGVGDYHLCDDGTVMRSYDQTGNYMFTGIRLCKKSIFNNSPDGAFSFLKLMDKAEKKGTLYGIVHQGDWHHISTPDDLKSVNKALSNGVILPEN